MIDPIQRLEALLGPVGETAEFLAQGSIPSTLPGLDVEGVGAVGLPISVELAQRLIAVADQAPYGRGTETIVDTEVRRVWQIEPARFALRNPVWDAQVRFALEAVKKQLGITGLVRHELYKLLIYEAGSFFAPHRDTEKTQGMFATLVVCLPSLHEGGTLIVEHEGKSVEIDFGGPESEFQTTYAAFYADCRHEIKSVRSGYRVCLVYNLALEQADRQPSAPRSSPAVAAARALLRELFDDGSAGRSKVVFPLEHQYTEAGLDPTALKGADRLRAEVLSAAAESLDYDCLLALITHYQSGSVDYETWQPSYYRSYRSRRGYNRYEREEAPEPDAGAEMEEVYDETLTLDHWRDMSGRVRSLGELKVHDGELLCGDDRKDWAVSQQVQEASGNEGASMERWYRQGVLVIWPRDRFFRILAAEGQDIAVPELERMMEAAQDPAALSACRDFAGAILDYWEPGDGRQAGIPWRDRMFTVLQRVGTVDLARRFVVQVLPRDFRGSEGESLHRLCRRFGWEHLQPALITLVKQQQPSSWGGAPVALLSLLAPLYAEPATWTPEHRSVCTALARELAGVLERWGNPPELGWRPHSPSSVGFVANTVRVFSLGGEPEAQNRFVERAVRGELGCDLYTVLIPDTKVIAAWLSEAPAARPAYLRLREHCLEQLRAATAVPVVFPTDWRRAAELGCKCQDCQALSSFLADPSTPEVRFSVAEQRRSHLAHQIGRQQIDCACETERKGRPYTLICRKTTASYDRRERQYQLSSKLLAEIEQLPSG